MAEIRWNADDIEVFLKIYRKYRRLWDSSSADYASAKTNARHAVFTKLVQEVNAAGLNVRAEPLKKKIKSLRDTYRNELNRIKKAEENGVCREPKLAWFATAKSFLHDSVFAGGKKPASVFVTDTDSSEPTSSENTIKVEVFSCSETSQDPLQGAHTPQGTGKRSFTNPETELRRAKITRTESSLDSHEYAVSHLHDAVHHQKSPGSDDQYDKFAKHIAAQLRELPLRSFVMLQDKIQNLISTERLSYLDRKNSV